MGYYDNVKDSIRDENGDKTGKESSQHDESSSAGVSGNFDTLREAAEETEVKDEEGGDETPIEVLEEKGLRQEASSKSQQQTQKRGRTTGSKKKSSTERRGTGSEKVQEASRPSNNEVKEISGDTSELEDKLDKIIEQNAQMIEILESFGN